MTRTAKIYDSAEAVARALRPSYPIYCLRPHVLAKQAKRFISAFPGNVLYAVKCNPHPQVIGALYDAGIRHFDTASLPEIAQVAESYPDARAYFMHPVKGRAVIQSAYEVYGVRHYVVDHTAELEKILQETKGAKDLVIVVRLQTPEEEGVMYHLASKFGATPEEAVELLKSAAAAGCDVGLAFHVGSQCKNPNAYRNALRLCGEVLEKAGVEPHCIDVGGGFPGRYRGMNDIPPIEDFIDAIRDGVKAAKIKPSVDLYCEPGRGLVWDGVSLLVQVQLRKDNRLYINDGIYGALAETVQGNLKLPARLVRPDGPHSEEFAEFSLSGPTCDSLDVLPGTYSLPQDVREGDWLEIDQVGAYSFANATKFNGFYTEAFVVVNDAPIAAAA